jgi:hypothetical protein
MMPNADHADPVNFRRLRIRRIKSNLSGPGKSDGGHEDAQVSCLMNPPKPLDGRWTGRLMHIAQDLKRRLPTMSPEPAGNYGFALTRFLTNPKAARSIDDRLYLQ